VVGIWIATDSSVKETRVVGVLSYGAEIENPVVLPMSMLEKFLRVFLAIPIQAFYPCGWVSHNYDLIREIYQV
jgi:hypothetical protein